MVCMLCEMSKTSHCPTLAWFKIKAHSCFPRNMNPFSLAHTQTIHTGFNRNDLCGLKSAWVS